MKVRAFDETSQTYFKSEVYAIINGTLNGTLYEKYLLYKPDTKIFRLFDRSYDPDSNTLNIIIPDRPQKWISRHFYEKTVEYQGFDWIFKDKSTLSALLDGKEIPLEGSIFEGRLYSDNVDGFSYVETKQDAEYLMCESGGFHDSTIASLSYVSGSFVGEGKSMHPFDDVRRVQINIHSQFCDNIEMVFEGTTELNLRPAGDNYCSIILDGTVIVEDGCVYFCDEYTDKIDTDYPDTWIKAYSLRWRFTG